MVTGFINVFIFFRQAANWLISKPPNSVHHVVNCHFNLDTVILTDTDGKIVPDRYGHSQAEISRRLFNENKERGTVPTVHVLRLLSGSVIPDHPGCLTKDLPSPSLHIYNWNKQRTNSIQRKTFSYIGGPIFHVNNPALHHQ